MNRSSYCCRRCRCCPISLSIGCPHKNANLSFWRQIWQLANLRLERQICFFPYSTNKTLQNANFKFVHFLSNLQKSTNLKFDICRFLSNLTKKVTNLTTNLLVWTPYLSRTNLTFFWPRVYVGLWAEKYGKERQPTAKHRSMMDGAVTVPFNDGRAVTAPLYGVRRRTIMNGFWQLHSASLSALLIGLRSQRQVQRQVFSTAGGKKSTPNMKLVDR